MCLNGTAASEQCLTIRGSCSPTPSKRHLPNFLFFVVHLTRRRLKFWAAHRCLCWLAWPINLYYTQTVQGDMHCMNCYANMRQTKSCKRGSRLITGDALLNF